MKLLLLLLSLSALAANTYKTEGGVEISNGDVLAGTAHIGETQLQPHYLVDSQDESFQALSRELSSKLKGKGLSELEKIEVATQFVESKFQRTAYDDAAFMRANLEKIRKGEAIRLSEIIKGGAGVCREHNLILHLLLKDQGVPTRYITAKVASGPSPALLKTEDHSLLLYNLDPADPRKGRVTLDAYFHRFHGQNFEKLTGAGKPTGSFIDRTLTNRDSIFPRIKAEQIETIALLGERNYEYKLDPKAVNPNTGKLTVSAPGYKLQPDRPDPFLGAGCRKRMLKALLNSL
jgi:hypothetical protein